LSVDSVVILITAPTKDEGQKIAQLLLERRKAACVNIVPGVDSLFWWQGTLDSAQEVLLIVKTRAELTKQVVELVKQVHSYTTPEVIALPIVTGSEDYLSWIHEETRND
jgi:periplasmic divalent cation tolerance protein